MRILDPAEEAERIHGKEIATIIMDGGYRWSMPDRHGWIEHRDGVRGLQIDLDDILSPPYRDLQPLERTGRSRSINSCPAFISGRLGDPSESPYSEQYERAYNRIWADFTNNGTPRLNLLSSLKTLHDCIEDEITHRAVRAADYTITARNRLAVLFYEWMYHTREAGYSASSDEAQVWEQCRLVGWDLIRTGGSLDKVGGWVSAAQRNRGPIPYALFDLQREGVLNVLDFREPELNLAVEAEARRAACFVVLRAAAAGRDVPKLGERLNLPHLAVLGMLLWNDGAKGKEDRATFETLRDLAMWGSDQLAARDRSVGTDRLRRILRESPFWESPGRGKRDPEAVSRLVGRLQRHWLDEMRRYE